MPLNRLLGEFMPEFGRMYRIVPLEPWTQTPFFGHACEHAAKVFKEAGAFGKIRFLPSDILVQQYPLTSKLLFLFSYSVKGQEMFTHYVFELSPEAVREFAASGMWDMSLPHDVATVN